MKRLSFLFTVALSLAGAAAAGGAERHTFAGRYMSGYQDRPQTLRAVFTPGEEDDWEVVFYFRYGGADHAWAGTARGSLTDGELSGLVTTENGARTFTFRGEVEDGVFEGTHAEVERGRERKTGTLSLRG